MIDCIIIKGLKVFAYHGVNPEEKQYGQNFLIDIRAYADLSEPCKSDDVDDTVSYAKIIKSVKRIFTYEKDDLIERAAMRVLEGLFDEFDALTKIRITIKKPDAPIKSEFDFVGVEITRQRQDMI